MTDVTVIEENSIILHTEEPIPASVNIQEEGATSIVSVTADGDNIVVSSEVAPNLLMITSGGSAYQTAVTNGFVGNEVDWIYSITNDKASVTYVDNLWANLGTDISAQNTELRQVIASTEQALTQNIDTLTTNFNAAKSNIDSIELSVSTQEEALAQTAQTLRTEFNTDINSQISLVNTSISNLDQALSQQALDLTSEFDNGFTALNTQLNQTIANESAALSLATSNLEAKINNDITALNTSTSQAYTDLETSVSQTINTMEAEFENKFATNTEVNTAVSNSELSMAQARQLLEANMNNELNSKVDTVNQAIANETAARSQSILSLQSDIDGKSQSNANLILETNSNVSGLSTAIAGLRTAVSGVDSQSSAELALESLVSDTETALSRAHLKVENTVNGVTSVSGITIGGVDNAIDLTGNRITVSNTLGEKKLYWDTLDTNKLTINAKLVLDDGHTVNNLADIRALDGLPGAGIYGGEYASISWVTSVANERVRELSFRNPKQVVIGDILSQKDSSTGETETRQYNGAVWIEPQLSVNGSIIATNTISGDTLIAGTSINAPQIIGGTLNLGNGNFAVDSSGNTTINKGSININAGRFSVSSTGDLTATNANITGSIKAGSSIESSTITGSTMTATSFNGGSIDIGTGNFVVDSLGNMTANSGVFNGTIGVNADISGKTPQQLVNEVTAANNLANTAKGEVTALENSLGSIAYNDVIEKAMLGSTLIIGGYLNTQVIEADTISGEKIKAGTSLTAPVINGGEINSTILNTVHINAGTGNFSGDISGSNGTFEGTIKAERIIGEQSSGGYANNVRAVVCSAGITPIPTQTDATGTATVLDIQIAPSNVERVVILSGPIITNRKRGHSGIHLSWLKNGEEHYTRQQNLYLRDYWDSTKAEDIAVDILPGESPTLKLVMSQGAPIESDGTYYAEILSQTWTFQLLQKTTLATITTY